MSKHWRFRGGDEKPLLPPDLVEATGSPLVAELLYRRNIRTGEAAQRFLTLSAQALTPGHDLPEVAAAVARIQKALKAKEPILVYGDFDVDGLTGTSIFMETLTHLGATVSYYIPDRVKEGHGLNTAALCRLVSSRGLKLVITTDTGITAFAEVSLLKGLGVDTIVTDHHGLPENFPPSVANVNPMCLPEGHPLRFLCGAGTAFKICEILLQEAGAEAAVIERLLDLTAIGTVADLVPLQEENRLLVHRGLQVLNRRSRMGLRQILEHAGTPPEKDLTSESIAFTIAPRLNALGRLANATEAVELLTTHDAERARELAAQLEHLNRRRQELCDKTFLEAEQHLSNTGGLDGRKAIVLGNPGWEPGIIGIVASRLIDKYHVPTFLMTTDEATGEVRGSARGIEGFHVLNALEHVAPLLSRFGGHSGAGGFTLADTNVARFKEELLQYAATHLSDEMTQPVTDVDAALGWSQVNLHLVDMLAMLAPFGQQNPAPVFRVQNATIAAQRRLGTEGQHLKLVLMGDENSATPIEALLWRHGSQPNFNPQEHYDLVVSVERNQFNGQEKVQLIVEDIRVHGTSPRHYEERSSAQAGGAMRQSPESKPLSPVQEIANPASAGTGSVALRPRSNSLGQAVQWFDHRQRNALQEFVGQLMMPGDETTGTVVLYHEGKAPTIPFLDTTLIQTRLSAPAAETLILWDLPPTLAHFQNLLQRVQPRTVHVLGGKYPAVPVFPTPENYLKLLLQTLHKRGLPQGVLSQVALPELASALATAEPVILHGLTVLEGMGWISVQPSATLGPDTPGSVYETRLQLTLHGQQASQRPLSLMELAFRQSLAEVGQFRHWLLTSPLDTIETVMGQSVVGLQPSLSTLISTPVFSSSVVPPQEAPPDERHPVHA